MRSYAPRTRAPVQAKAASPPRRAQEERPAALPAGLRTGLSLADVPIHARPAQASRPAGLPQPLKTGVERLSGLAMDDVRVHRDSLEPVRLGALAYTQGRDIFLGRGQERHLPHEAWHVVQQMQGRVPATGRLGDLALNEDPALEADADHMGARAGGAPARPPAQLRRAPLQAGAVQRKVWDGVRPLGASQPMSEVLRQYVTSKVTYFLGTDSRADLTALPVHLIDSRVKYLLGEKHDSGEWYADTKQWPIIPKMVEEEKAIPHEKDDTTGRLDVAKPFALENRHAYLLMTLLDVHEYTNKLNAQFAGGADWQRVTHVQGYADRIDDKLGQIQKSVADYEVWATKYGVVNQEGFAAKYDPKRHGASARLTQIKTFADNLSRAWSVSLDAMMITAQTLSQFMEDLERRKVWNLKDDNLEAARLQVAEIAKGKGAISALSTALTGLLGFSSAKDEKAVRAFATSSQSAVPKPVDDAINLERERGMIANIKAAEAPLLVRIGNDHLASVAKEAGNGIQAIDKTENLKTFTARHTFLEPVVEK